VGTEHLAPFQAGSHRQMAVTLGEHGSACGRLSVAASRQAPWPLQRSTASHALASAFSVGFAHGKSGRMAAAVWMSRANVKTLIRKRRF
jgi:hypothetical protein